MDELSCLWLESMRPSFFLRLSQCEDESMLNQAVNDVYDVTVNLTRLSRLSGSKSVAFQSDYGNLLR